MNLSQGEALRAKTRYVKEHLSITFLFNFPVVVLRAIKREHVRVYDVNDNRCYESNVHVIHTAVIIYNRSINSSYIYILIE